MDGLCNGGDDEVITVVVRRRGRPLWLIALVVLAVDRLFGRPILQSAKRSLTTAIFLFNQRINSNIMFVQSTFSIGAKSQLHIVSN